MRKSKAYGGPAGGTFDDKSSWKYQKITAIKLECSDKYMSSIQMKYGDTWGPKHGSVPHCSTKWHCKSYMKTLDAANDERIESVEMIHGRSWWNVVLIHKAKFNTNKGELITCGGDTTHSGRKADEWKGYRLQYISGRSGEFVDNLKFHWTEK